MRCFRTRSSDPRRIEKCRIVHFELALDDRPLGLPGPLFGTEQVLGIDFKLDALESGYTDDGQEHGHQKEVPWMPGHHVAKPVKCFRQPFVNAFYAARHICKTKIII